MTAPLPLWGGIECTVNRVGDRYSDQLVRSGHHARLADLDLVHGLGVRVLRYPLLWERTVQGGWDWVDERVARLQALGLSPIVGLVHHGSGPPSTSLVEESFVEGLADYAGALAARHPGIRDYCPVNEPLTTARFSGLYGHWYPHARDDRTFARALLVQTRAIRAAMRRIRVVRPDARLIQTEDLGRCASRPPLARQAEFENERRWLTFDLLGGRVDRTHPLHAFLVRAGVTADELADLTCDPCPPDILGINYYVTSERFLDDRLALYPRELAGGNGRQRYVDVDAVRSPAGLVGPRVVLLEAAARYQRPLAITEAHMGCTREDQMRWLAYVWDQAVAARAQGADVRGVTVWSLFGSFDWNRLVTVEGDYYEPGAFDVRAPAPRETGIAHVVRDLAAGRAPRHPVLDVPGWWQRPGPDVGTCPPSVEARG